MNETKLKFMNHRIFQVIAVMALSGSSAMAEEKLLSAYTTEQFHDLIEQGGEPLIKAHGDELLSLLYFKRKPTDAELLEMTSNPRITKETKRDLPVFQALRNAGDATLQLLRHSTYFDYPQHPTDLEVIAYLLQEIMERDAAASFAEDRINEETAYARDNWLTINDMLKRPELASGHFIVERTAKGSTVEPAPTIEQLRKERMQIKKLLTMMPPEDSSSFLSIHRQFRKVLEACLLSHTAKKKWPSSLYSLVQEGKLKESELAFLDRDQFWYVPRLSKNTNNNNIEHCVLKLDTPDGKFTIQGFLSGRIDAIQAERK